MDRIEEHMFELRRKAVAVSQALRKAAIPHAVIGGLAVGAYVAQKAPELVRTTRDLDILLRGEDLKSAARALEPHGFRYRKVMRIPAFIPAGGKFADAVHVVFAGQKVRDNDPVAAPLLKEGLLWSGPDQVIYLDLPNLVRMKLNSFRINDRGHLRDLIEAKLINAAVERTIPRELRARYDEIRAEVRRERLP